METKICTKEQKMFFLLNFLHIEEKYKKYEYQSNIHWVYSIKNIGTGEMYVGKTKDIRRRALNYINNFLKGENTTKIDKAFQQYGIDYFEMTVLEIAFTSKSASIKEIYYIDLYDTVNTGYNMILGSPATEKRSFNRKIFTEQTLYAKTVKSKNMCAIDTKNKIIIFSTGLKLFGDYINRGKDEIKSVAKRQTRIDGYFVYYLNTIDFNTQCETATLKIIKNSVYSDCNLQYPDFIKYANYLKEYLINGSNAENFKIIFITQSNDPKGYKFADLNRFLDYYKTLPNNLSTC